MTSVHNIINKIEDSSEHGLKKIYDGPYIEDEPIISGQIKIPGSSSIMRFTDLFLPVIKRKFGNRDDLRVLEIGSGMGNAAYGAISTVKPIEYIASEPFVYLLPTLRCNLDRWGYEWPKGQVAAYDANYPANIKPESMDLVLSDSVLHHVLNWRESLDSLVQLLDDGGMMIFGEPNYESWSYIVTLLRGAMREYSCKHKSDGDACQVFSTETCEKLVKFVRSLELRFSRKDDVEFLNKLEDKHLFSVTALMEYAQERNLKLLIENSGKDFFNTVFEKVQSQLIVENDKRIFKEYLDDVVPSGISESILAEPFMVFSLHV